MIRKVALGRPATSALVAALTLGLCAGLASSAHAQDKPAKPAKTETKKPAAKKPDAKKPDAKKTDSKKPEAKKGAGKPEQVATFGDWGAFVTKGASKTCYALASPKDRVPAALKRDPAYVFISNRPGENVYSEISIIMGFAMKDGGEGRADVGGVTFDLIAKGTNAWIKNPAEEGQFIDALKKGSKLTIKAASIKGNTTTDNYSLSGLSQAMDRVKKDCP